MLLLKRKTCSKYSDRARPEVKVSWISCNYWLKADKVLNSVPPNFLQNQQNFGTQCRRPQPSCSLFFTRPEAAEALDLMCRVGKWVISSDVARSSRRDDFPCVPRSRRKMDLLDQSVETGAGYRVLCWIAAQSHEYKSDERKCCVSRYPKFPAQGE